MSSATDRATLSYFTDQLYGVVPATAGAATVSWQQLEEGPSPHGGLRRQLRLTISAPSGPDTNLTLLVNLPDSAEPGATPVFVGMNFPGNHATTTDPAVLDLTDPDPAWGDRLHPRADTGPAARGSQTGRWDHTAIVGRGWASVTLCYLQVGPDTPEIFAGGPHRTLGGDCDREPTEWGAIGIWAWTLSRVLDALAAGMVPEIDATRAIVHGHSRLGKTAIWSGVTDRRWAAVISNNSGAGGAALSRNRGETPQDLLARFPYWFAPRFAETAAVWQQIHDGAPQQVPDQPDLLALVAPRPLYVASASEDDWADPEGEFLAWQQASAAWPHGTEATAGGFPSPGTVLAPSAAPLGYHLRDGGHDVTSYDWAAWLNFADRWVR